MTEQRESGSPTADPFAEVRVIDSQLQHFRNYIDLIQVFKCRICSFCSPLEHVIASHMSEVHFPRRCFLCKQCLFVFEDRSQLNSHLDSAHGTRSIAVCFGETGPYANSPPTWHVGVGRSSEDDEQLSRQSTEEQTENEPHNGRVTSSTGNLANLPDGGQMERGNSASSLSVPAEGEFLRGTPTACESRQEQVLSRGSSCNPSTTDQDLSATSEPNPILLTQQDSSQERTSRQTSEESPYQPNAETPKLPEVGKENYIKVEPVSPVRIMCPKRRRLLQASYSGESTDIDAEGRNNSESASRHSPSVHPSQNTDASQRNSATEEATKQSPPVPAGRGGATGRRPESVLRGLLRRQETIEDMDAEVPSDPSGEKSPPQEPQNMTRSASLTDSSLPYSRESALPRQSSEPIISHAERQGETVENKSHDALSPVSVDNNNGEMARKSMLHDLVSRTVPKKSERRCSEGTIFRKTGSIDETSTRQPAPRSSRQRSYSLTEGDARLPPNSIATDLSNQQASETPQEKEPSHPPMTYRPREHTRMASSFWPRYSGLVYPPFAVDNDPTKIWRSFPPYQSQASVQSEPPVPSRPHSEHGKVPMPTQMSEDSFLYNYLRHPSNMGPKRKHNPAALSNQNSADAVAPGWPGENQFADAGRVGMVGHHGVPWHHYHRGLQHHMLIRQNADDKSASPSITSTSHRPGRKPDSFIYSNLERSPSMQGGGEMRSFERRRPPMLEHGGSSESSQELVQVEDITRQVHRAISGSSGLYSGERAAVAWSDQSSGNNTSQEEQSGKDADLKKRSRKSTFNIYREIPERKRKLDRDEEERIKSSYNADGSFDYFSLTGWKAYKCELCKKRRFKTASELEEHKRRKHSLHHTHIGNASSSSSSGVGASLDETSSSPQLTPQLSNG